MKCRYAGRRIAVVTAGGLASSGAALQSLLVRGPAFRGLRFETELPPFEARDITGRMWRLDHLRGKLTLICIWYTFEARAVDAHDGRVREVIAGLSIFHKYS